MKETEYNPTENQRGWQVYKRLLSYVKPMWLMFLMAILGNIGFASVDAAMIAMMQPLLDQGFIAHKKDVFKYLPLAIIGIVLLRGIMSFIATYCMDYVGRYVVMVMRQQVFARLMILPMKYFDNHTSGQLLSCITYNTTQVASASTDALRNVVRETATIIFLLGLMFYHSWQLTLISLVIAPAIGLVVNYVSKRFRIISRRIQESMGGITHVTEESLEGVKAVKIFGGTEHAISGFNKIVNRNRQQEMKMIATKATASPIVQFCVVIVLAFVIHLASLNSLEETITAGTFVSMIVAMMALMRPIKKLMDVNNYIQKGIAAAESIFAILDEAPEKNLGTQKIEVASGRLSFKEVSFEYSQGRGKVLKNINLDVSPGETIALVGKSGGGKTTLVNLLPRFYDEYEGEIRLDGIELRDLELTNLRQQIALVSQHITLFNDSIRNNIAYGALTGYEESSLLKAAHLARVTDFADKMPEGLETIVGENGVTLSGGQRQRIAIARAILSQAPILILDEATSALDTESERLIQIALDDLIKDRTTFVIAHRLSTIENADKILVMEEGSVVEAGTHMQLLQLNGHYAKYYKLQFQDKEQGVFDLSKEPKLEVSAI